ncbi:hypothetical protein [Microbulbifer sp. SSSA005]|uniref:hypothetical protein n=1 Tax=Microbulbifer sp. SSSA005 TaxID=3243378 RepID=UPI00403914C7
MKLPTLIFSLALVCIVSGCASNQHIYSSDGKCLTCWNNPVTGDPINHDGNTRQQQAAQESQMEQTSTTDKTAVNTSANKPTNHKIAFTVPVNVDVVFMKIKREFEYQSTSEIQQEFGSLASTKMQNFEYHYDIMPSMYYHMRDTRMHNGVITVIDFRVEKVADKESSIEITYWPQAKSVNAIHFGESLKDRTRKALNI